MVYARKKSRVYKKTNRSNSRAISKVSSKGLVSLIKKVSKGQAETGSSYWNTGSQSIIKQQLYAWNIMSACGLSNITGSNDSGLIKGDSIQPIGLSFKGMIENNTNSTAHTTIAIIKTAKYTTLSGGFGSGVDLMRFGDNLNHLPRWNTEECQVLFSKTYKATNQVVNISNPTMVDEYVKFNANKLQFQDFSSDFSLKNGNYYVVVHSSTIPGTIGTTVVTNVDLNFRFYYKDF